jgi:maleylacetoacetate isomerase
MSDLVLYNYFRSSTSYRARIALHWKNLAFDYQPVHLLNNGGEQHQAQYQNLNTLREVPTLVHQGIVIAQSMAIIEYLDEAFPQCRLFPMSATDRAHVRQVCENVNSNLHPVGNLKVLQYLVQTLNVSETQKFQWLSHWYDRGLEATERCLEKTSGTYAFGGEVTAADVFIVPQMTTCQRFGYDTSKFPVLSRIQKNCESLDAFKKAHPGRQIDTPPELKIS